MEKIKVLVCAHKPDPNTKNEGIYQAIQVGKALHPELDMGYLNDNTGDNISTKNPNWCELTALYWGWKNLKNVEYTGLCHYRRYFGIGITEENIDSIMKDIDLLTIKSNNYKRYRNELYLNLIKMTSNEDFYIYLDTLVTLYPQYKSKIIDFFFNSRISVPFTMFIAKKELYDEFCSFVFPICFALEKKILPHGYSRQKRIIGYFGEVSLGVFVACKGLRIKEVPLEMYGKIQKSKSSTLFKMWRYGTQKIVDFITFVEGSPKDITVPNDVRMGLQQDGIELQSLK